MTYSNDDTMIMNAIKNYFSFEKLITIFFLSFLFFPQAANARKIHARLNAEEAKMYEFLIAGDPAEKQFAVMQCGLVKSNLCTRQLMLYLDDPDAKIRYESAQSLGRIANPTSLDRLTEKLEQISQEEKEDEDIQNLQKEIEQNSLTSQELKPDRKKTYNHFALKARIIWAIGEIKDPKSVEKIEPYLQDKSPRIRRSTAIALKEIQTPDALTALKNAYEAEKDDRVKVSLVAGIFLMNPSDSQKAQELFQLLSSSDWLARYDAANYIYQMRLREARDSLRGALLTEEHNEVRVRLFKAYQMAINPAVE